MFANLIGLEVVCEGAVTETEETAERLRDLILIRLTSRGVSQRFAARVLNVAQATVSKRLAQIPPEVKRHYGASTLGKLDETGT